MEKDIVRYSKEKNRKRKWCRLAKTKGNVVLIPKSQTNNIDTQNTSDVLCKYLNISQNKNPEEDITVIEEIMPDVNEKSSINTDTKMLEKRSPKAILPKLQIEDIICIDSDETEDLPLTGNNSFSSKENGSLDDNPVTESCCREHSDRESGCVDTESHYSKTTQDEFSHAKSLPPPEIGYECNNFVHLKQPGSDMTERNVGVKCCGKSHNNFIEMPYVPSYGDGDLYSSTTLSSSAFMNNEIGNDVQVIDKMLWVPCQATHCPVFSNATSNWNGVPNQELLTNRGRIGCEGNLEHGLCISLPNFATGKGQKNINKTSTVDGNLGQYSKNIYSSLRYLPQEKTMAGISIVQPKQRNEESSVRFTKVLPQHLLMTCKIPDVPVYYSRSDTGNLSSSCMVQSDMTPTWSLSKPDHELTNSTFRNNTEQCNEYACLQNHQMPRVVCLHVYVDDVVKPRDMYNVPSIQNCRSNRSKFFGLTLDWKLDVVTSILKYRLQPDLVSLLRRRKRTSIRKNSNICRHNAHMDALSPVGKHKDAILNSTKKGMNHVLFKHKNPTNHQKRNNSASRSEERKRGRKSEKRKRGILDLKRFDAYMNNTSRNITEKTRHSSVRHMDLYGVPSQVLQETQVIHETERSLSDQQILCRISRSNKNTQVAQKERCQERPSESNAIVLSDEEVDLFDVQDEEYVESAIQEIPTECLQIWNQIWGD